MTFRLVKAWLFTACFFCAASGTVRADTLAAPRDVTAIAADMLAAIGPQNDNYRVSIIGNGTEGRTIESSYHRGGDVLISFSRGTRTTMRGTYRDAGWIRNANGVTIATDPQSDAYQPPSRGTLARVSSPVDAFVINDLDSHGYGKRTFVNPSTYRVIREEYIGADGTGVRTTLDYARFGTQTLPAHWRYDDPGSNDVMTYERIQFVAGDTTEAQVAVPATRPFVRLPATTPVDLHATVDSYTQRTTLPVTIAGKTFTFIVSSAQSGIRIDANVAKRLGLVPIDEQQAGANKRFQRNDVLIPDMDLSGVHLRDMVVSTDFYDRDGPIVGTLGFDFFAELVVTFDYRHHQLRVVAPHQFVVPSGKLVSALDLDIASQSVETAIDLNGETAQHVEVSTYTDTLLLISHRYASAHPSLTHFLRSDPMRTIDPYAGLDFVTGARGYFHTRVYGIDEVHVGSFAFKGLDAAIVDSSDFDYADGLIGTGFLSDFRVDFDVPEGRMYLTTDQRPKR